MNKRIQKKDAEVYIFNFLYMKDKNGRQSNFIIQKKRI